MASWEPSGLNFKNNQIGRKNVNIRVVKYLAFRGLRRSSIIRIYFI